MNENALDKVSETYSKILNEMQKVIVGQKSVIEEIVISFFTGGHVLLEGVPGLAKTLIAKTLTHVFGGTFKRVQFTPDLMPSDIIGTTVFDTGKNEFIVKQGPVFTNMLLADEINRAPAKTQSALLQAMQEHAVNIDGTDYDLGSFFICIATQNPIEMEGTYPLPEAQTDRFLMKLFIDYPSLSEEKDILNMYRSGHSPDDFDSHDVKQILNNELFLEIKKCIELTHVDDKIIDYITKIVQMTREFPGIEVGSSPRGSVALFKAGRVKAMLNGRDFVTPDDIKSLALPILRHRIMLDAETEIEGETTDEYVKRILDKTEVPR